MQQKTHTDYKTINSQLKSLIENVDNPISNLANASALLWENLENINWVGFYTKNKNLELGPFQGKVACTKIEIGKGVCGTAVAENKTQRIENVHLFPGHIACDGASNSEIVIPIHKGKETIGVLDIDSPSFGRFSEKRWSFPEKYSMIAESQDCISIM